LGFLIFNFPPASIFLGDCGALFLGFILATLPMISSRKAAVAVALLVPIIALGIPIFDTTLAIIRRRIRGRDPFSPDREHLHHRLLAMGFTQREVTLWLYAASAVLTAMAIFMSNASRVGALAILLTIGAVAVVAVRRLGLDEVQALWGMVRHGERRRRPPRYRTLLVRNTIPLLERCANVAELRSFLEEIRRGLDLDTLIVRLTDDRLVTALGVSEIVLGEDRGPLAISQRNAECEMRNGTMRNGECGMRNAEWNRRPTPTSSDRTESPAADEPTRNAE
jgi:UDP-GlcNAc:undecaprenyl-phosphate GlcNAc-1-phosphate transferase